MRLGVARKSSAAETRFIHAEEKKSKKKKWIAMWVSNAIITSLNVLLFHWKHIYMHDSMVVAAWHHASPWKFPTDVSMEPIKLVDSDSSDYSRYD